MEKTCRNSSRLMRNSSRETAMLVASNSTDGRKQGITAEDAAEVCIGLETRQAIEHGKGGMDEKRGSCR